MTESDMLDPRGLIREAYRIEGIGEPECRSIFLDWALQAPDGEGAREAIRGLLDRHGAAYPDHPMTKVLTDGLGATRAKGRRGGWRARRGG